MCGCATGVTNILVMTALRPRVSAVPYGLRFLKDPWQVLPFHLGEATHVISVFKHEQIRLDTDGRVLSLALTLRI